VRSASNATESVTVSAFRHGVSHRYTVIFAPDWTRQTLGFAKADIGRHRSEQDTMADLHLSTSSAGQREKVSA
jgi:hypothetical protein